MLGKFKNGIETLLTSVQIWETMSPYCYQNLTLGFILNLKREFVMQRRTIILPSTQRSMCQICRSSNWCRASNLRSMSEKPLRGCTIIGTLPMMELNIWGLTSIFHQKLCPLPWRNPQSLPVALWVVPLVIVHGNLSSPENSFFLSHC